MYISYFRSTDTTNDPKGQLYKVVFLNDNAQYPYTTSYNIPSAPKEELTMGEEPFVVTYEADNDNIYKPYKCSRASIRLFLSHLYLDLIPKKKNSIKILLLKEKQNIKKIIFPSSSREYYLNEDTQERLNKTIIRDDSGNIIYSDYPPESYDKFAYTLEWVGYLTPTSGNQPFTNPNNTYELEAQDSLSSLKYFDFNPWDYINDNNLDKNAISFIDAITSAFTPILNDYTDIYITNTTHQASVISTTPNAINCILSNAYIQPNNFFDEYEEASTSLEVVENILQFLNLTMVPWKDKIYILNYDSIVQERKIYYRYSNINNRYVLDSNTYVEGKNIETLTDTWGHNISYSTTYKEVEVKADEYKIEDTIPDITSIKNSNRRFLFDEITTIRKPREQAGGTLSRQFYYDNTQIHYTGEIYNNPDNVVTYSYTADTVTRDSMNFEDAHWSTTLTSQPTTLQQLNSKVGCDIINFGTNEYDPDLSLSSILTSYPNNYAYYFHTKNNTKQRDDSTGRTPGWQKKGNFHTGSQPPAIQPLLTITTKPALITTKDAIVIDGNLTFFNDVIPTANNWKRDLAHTYFSLNPKYSYIWLKIKCKTNNQYLKNLGDNDYTWVAGETWCKLWYAKPGYVKSEKYTTWGLFGRDVWNEVKADAFENTFSFLKNTRRYDGTVIPLINLFGTNQAMVAEFEITFNRPVGCAITDSSSASYDVHQLCPAQSTILQNFDIKLVTRESANQPPSSDQQNDNTFKVKMEEDAYDDFDTINLKLTSGRNQPPTQSAILWKYPYNTLLNIQDKTQNIVNEGNGNYCLPEHNIASTIANNYEESRQYLECTTTRDITPLDSYIWWYSTPTQQGQLTIMPAFIINSLSINYQYNEKTLNLAEVKRVNNSTLIAKWQESIKNKNRHGDNLYHQKINSTPEDLNIILLVDDVTNGSINSSNGRVFITNRHNRPANDNAFEVLTERGQLFLNTHNLSSATAQILNNNLILNI